MLRDFVIGLGSNLGERAEHLAQGASAIAVLAEVELSALSSVFETPALGPPQPAYFNAALRLQSTLAADALLERLLAIERAQGRVRTLRWGPRTLDLDVLWSSEPWRSEALIVPHVELTARNFALAPLLEVAPELRGVYADILAQLGGAPLRVGRLAFATNPAALVVFETELPTPM